MVEFRPLLISFIIIALFSVGMINIVYFTQVQNDAEETILDDSVLGLSSYKSNVEANLTSTYEDSLDAEESASSSQVTFSFGSPFLDAISGVWKTIKSGPVTLYHLVIGLLRATFLSGTDGIIIISAIVSILTISIIFAVWKMISTGEAG